MRPERVNKWPNSMTDMMMMMMMMMMITSVFQWNGYSVKTNIMSNCKNQMLRL